jgi:hypothetical protein
MNAVFFFENKNKDTATRVAVSLFWETLIPL